MLSKTSFLFDSKKQPFAIIYINLICKSSRSKNLRINYVKKSYLLNIICSKIKNIYQFKRDYLQNERWHVYAKDEHLKLELQDELMSVFTLKLFALSNRVFQIS